MKNVKTFMLLAFVSIAMISCSKDDDNELKDELNKLNYDGELYSLESFTVEGYNGDNYFIYENYCITEKSVYVHKFSFYYTKSIKPQARAPLTVYIGPFTKNIQNPLPIELNSNVCQSICNCLYVSFIEENNMNSPIRHTSVIAHAEIISIKPIEIKLEGVFENDEKFKLHFKGNSIPGFPYGR